MDKKKLLRLADFLETIPRKAFSITNWVTRYADKPEGEVPGECGFAGCAVGWAAHQKLFKGLRISEGGSYPEYIGTHGYVWQGFDAPKVLFNITDRQASELFHRDFYPANPKTGRRDPTPKQVAAKIRKFVKDSLQPVA